MVPSASSRVYVTPTEAQVLRGYVEVLAARLRELGALPPRLLEVADAACLHGLNDRTRAQHAGTQLRNLARKGLLLWSGRPSMAGRSLLNIRRKRAVPPPPSSTVLLTEPAKSAVRFAAHRSS